MSDTIEHHGVLGMRWGVSKAVNKGVITPKDGKLVYRKLKN